MRTFIAIELAPLAKQRLIDLLADLPDSRDVRWVTPDQLHLTLKFLGEVPEDRFDEVRAAAAQASASIQPFEIRLAGLGGFPGRRNPRVLWVGVDDPAQRCRAWVQAADPLLANLGYEPEQRAYTPHITLGRSKSPAGGRLMTDVLERHAAAAPAGTHAPVTNVREVVIFESRLHPKGAQYFPLAHVPLG